MINSDHYDKNFSSLLLSPTLTELNGAFGSVFSAICSSDMLTIFFAGHGAVSAGNFYLCVKNTRLNQFSLTAFSIVSLFTMINEFKIGQVNIVVDACEAGGSSYDLSNLLKSENIGTSSATSISFLGACAANQYAEEDDQGGILTNILLRHLRGEENVQTFHPYFDLIEVGNAVSRRVQQSGVAQVPICWGLTLSGQGRFAVNPLYRVSDEEILFRIENIPPFSDAGGYIQKYSAELWNEYRLINSDFNPRRLLDLLNRVTEEVRHDAQKAIVLIEGLAKSFSLRASNSTDILARSNIMATCAVTLLPLSRDNFVKRYVKDLLHQKILIDQQIQASILDQLNHDSHALLHSMSAVADLYYLPIRIFRILGWLGSSILAAKIFDWDIDDEVSWKLASSVIEKYEGAIAAINDEQAVGLYLFVKACQITDHVDLAKCVLNRTYASFAERGGKVARVSLASDHSFAFLLSLIRSENTTESSYKANPSNLLSVLLLLGHQLNFHTDWQLRDLDNESAGFFLPNNYKDFSQNAIEHGTNHVQQLGRGIWNLTAYNIFLQGQVQENLNSQIQPVDSTTSTLCIFCSLLFPDRIPLFIERILP